MQPSKPLVEMAIQAIKAGEEQFTYGNITFGVSLVERKKLEQDSMPSFLEHDGERYVFWVIS
jgi:hypothetical protein